MGPGVAWWLRHCATSRKVPGSIPGVAGVYSVASDSSMCPRVDSASKNEYQVNPGGKGGRCLRLTTYHLHVPMSRNLGASRNPMGLFRPLMGQLLYLYKMTVPQSNEISLTLYETTFFRATCTVYSPPTRQFRPKDGPVQGPKHVCLIKDNTAS
jgi:hypothetical protein